MATATKIIASAAAAAGYPPAEQTAINAFKEKKHACIILGATGHVGKCIVRDVIETDAFEKVTLLVRREVLYEGPNAHKLKQETVDFDNLEESSFAGHDVVFCALGTTRAQAGSAENFRKIDHDYVLSAAKLFKSANPSRPLQFHYCSSGGANASSSFLYMKTKGEIENSLRALNFARCGLFRPGFLGVEESRGDAWWANTLLPPLFKLFPSYATPVGVCARAMRRWAIDTNAKDGTAVVENAEILKLGA